MSTSQHSTSVHHCGQCLNFLPLTFTQTLHHSTKLNSQLSQQPTTFKSNTTLFVVQGMVLSTTRLTLGDFSTVVERCALPPDVIKMSPVFPDHTFAALQVDTGTYSHTFHQIFEFVSLETIIIYSTFYRYVSAIAKGSPHCLEHHHTIPQQATCEFSFRVVRHMSTAGLNEMCSNAQS